MLPKVVDVSLLVAPLDPSWSRGDAVDQHQAVDTLGVAKGVSQHHVGPQAHGNTHVAHNREVIDHLIYLK